jgi:hypothetical protein
MDAYVTSLSALKVPKRAVAAPQTVTKYGQEHYRAFMNRAFITR